MREFRVPHGISIPLSQLCFILRAFVTAIVHSGILSMFHGIQPSIHHNPDLCFNHCSFFGNDGLPWCKHSIWHSWLLQWDSGSPIWPQSWEPKDLPFHPHPNIIAMVHSVALKVPWHQQTIVIAMFIPSYLGSPMVPIHTTLMPAMMHSGELYFPWLQHPIIATMVHFRKWESTLMPEYHHGSHAYFRAL